MADSHSSGQGGDLFGLGKSVYKREDADTTRSLAIEVVMSRSHIPIISATSNNARLRIAHGVDH